VQVFLLALEAALYPTLLAAVVILLAQPRRVALLGAYLAGGLVMSIGIGLVIVFAVKGSGVATTSKSTLSWTVDLAVGGLSLLVAVALATRADQRYRQRRHAKKPPKSAAKNRDPWSERLLARGSVPIVFFAGVLINVPGAAYLVALKDIAVANHSTVQAILLIVAFNLIMFALAEVPFIGLIVAPARTEALVDRFDRWLSRNGRNVAMVVATVLGVYLVVRGIVNS